MKTNLIEFPCYESHNRMAKIKDLLKIDEYNLDLKQRLKLYEAIIAQIFEAMSCSIILFNRSELKRLDNTLYSGDDIDLKVNDDELMKLLGIMPRVDTEKSIVDQNEKPQNKVNINYALLSYPLISNGKVIGMIRIKKLERNINHKFDDLELLEVVTQIMNKLIKLDQLYNLINMRYQIFALKKSADVNSSIGVIAESPHSVNTAKILAKFIYQDIIKAGFDCKNIIYIVSEIISELNNDLKHSNSMSKSQVNPLSASL